MAKKKGPSKKTEELQVEEVQEVSVEELASMLLKGDKKKADKKFDKNLSLAERNKIDDENFIFKLQRYTWVVKKVGMDSLKLNDKSGMFAFGVCALGDRTICLHDTMDREFAFDTFTHELTHAVLFTTQADLYEEEGVSDEYICEFTSAYIDTIWEIREEFRKSALFKTFKEREL